MKQEDYNKNVFTEYFFIKRKGIDDLKSEYAFHGNSQGDESVSNDITIYSNSRSWMSYIFKDIPLKQEKINKEVLRRKKYNKNYINKLKKSGEFGKEYKQIIYIEKDNIIDNAIRQYGKTLTESYRLDILDLRNINKMKNKEEFKWIDINEWSFHKNFEEYMKMKFKDYLVLGKSEISVEEFKYWNEEWNK